jgi:hypothetical protein
MWMGIWRAPTLVGYCWASYENMEPWDHVDDDNYFLCDHIYNMIVEDESLMIAFLTNGGNFRVID